MKHLNKIGITYIPDGSFVVFRTDHPRTLVGSALASECKKRHIFGVIMSHEVKIDLMSDEDLKTHGLQRIKK